MEGWELRRERKSWCREMEKRSKMEKMRQGLGGLGFGDRTHEEEGERVKRPEPVY